MDVYKKDSDEFDPEYLAYLGTLTSEVDKGVIRVTKDRGEVVRVEFWAGAAYYVFPLRGWMNPDQSKTHAPQ